MSAVAIGLSKIEVGAVGDGVAGASLTALTDNIALGTAVFSFNEPTETKIEAEDTDDPVKVIASKGDPDYIEFGLITPSASTLALFGGGTASDPGTTGTNTKWEAPTSVPSINKTVKITSKTSDSKYYEYTVVNGGIFGRFSQMPGKTQEEQYLVRVYIEEAKSAAGVVGTPFIREQKSAT